jgi:integrase
MAYTFYYEDAERTDGTLYTRKVRHSIGRVAADGLSERAARREHDRIMQDVNLKRGSVAPTIHGKTFLDAVEAWRKAIAPALSPATVRGMESHLKIHILPRFKESAPHDLDVPTLQQFATDLIGRKLSQKSIANILQTIFTILKHAETCKISVCKVTIENLKLGGVGPKPAPYFSPSSSQAIIQAASEPHHTLFAVAALTGVRAGELLALNVSDLDFTNKTISISKSADNNTRIIREPKTKNSTATLPMPSALEAVLRNYLANHWKSNSPGLLFPNCKGTKPLNRDNLVKYVLKPILKKLGIPAHETGLHAFRHGLATELANASVPLPVLQRQMRHADVRTTLKVYSHLVSETHTDIMEKLAQRSIGTNVPISTEVNA